METASWAVQHTSAGATVRAELPAVFESLSQSEAAIALRTAIAAAAADGPARGIVAISRSKRRKLEAVASRLPDGFVTWESHTHGQLARVGHARVRLEGDPRHWAAVLEIAMVGLAHGDYPPGLGVDGVYTHNADGGEA